MFRVKTHLAFIASFSIFLTVLPNARPVQAQDLVATEDLAGGSSVFVFRESRKKAQSRGGGGRASSGDGGGGIGGSVGGGGGGGRVAKTNAQIAAEAAKRRAAAIAVRKKAAAVARDRKIAASNTLATKADGFLENNQTDLAIKNFRDALVQYPKNTRASGGLADALTAKGIEVAGNTNSLAAMPYFEEAVKIDAKNDVAYAKIGAIYDASGQSAKAISSYEKALSLNPGYSTLHTPLGMAYLDVGEIAKAEASLQKGEGAGTDTAESRLTRGIIFFKQNKNTEALAAFDKAAAMDPSSGAPQYYRGQVLDRMQQPDQAVAAFKKSLEIEPTFAPASFELGVTHYNKGDYNSAVGAYQNAIKYEPNNYQAHYNLASSYRQLERYPDANAEYKLAEVGIKTADLYSEWGFCLGKVKDWDSSVARLQTAKEISPTAVDNSNLGWAYYNTASEQKVAKNDAAATQNYNLAKASLQTAVQQDPKLDAAQLNLGSTHNGLGEFQAAVSVLQIALGLRPGWVVATNQLGLGFRGLGDLVNAVAAFKRVVDLDGRNTFGLFSLGEAYNASGNKKEAKKINDRLKKIDPTLAARLDNIFSGKAIVDKVVPKVRLPRFPF